MKGDVRELLPLYALGVLEGDELTDIEGAIERDPVLAAELATYQRTTDALAIASPPVAPPPDIKQRLLASAGAGRHESFSTRLARLYDVTLDRARELLGLIERPASWIQQVVPGIKFVDFEGGPAAAAADCGFVRLAPKAMFPPHTHVGEEYVIVLSGQIRDLVNNRIIGPGEDYIQGAGTSHYLECVSDEDCVYATRAIDGIEIGGVRAYPTK